MAKMYLFSSTQHPVALLALNIEGPIRHASSSSGFSNSIEFNEAIPERMYLFNEKTTKRRMLKQMIAVYISILQPNPFRMLLVPIFKKRNFNLVWARF